MIDAPRGVVFDHTALLALGKGHPLLSSMVAAPITRSPVRHVLVPALCLSAAVVERPALGEHVLALPAVEVVSIGFVEALAVGSLVGQRLPWPHSHAVVVCRPAVEWPFGRVLVTTDPDEYTGQNVELFRV